MTALTSLNLFMKMIKFERLGKFLFLGKNWTKDQHKDQHVSLSTFQVLVAQWA